MIHHHHFRILPQLRTLTLPLAMVPIAAALQTYLSGIRPEEVGLQFDQLEYLRPLDIPPLGLLAVRVPTLAELGHGSQHTTTAHQPSNPTGLPTLVELPVDLQDHTTFGMIKSPGHALAIEAELMAVNDKSQKTPVPASEVQAKWLQMKDDLCRAIVDFSRAAELETSSRYKQVKSLKNIEVEVLASKLTAGPKLLGLLNKTSNDRLLTLYRLERHHPGSEWQDRYPRSQTRLS